MIRAGLMIATALASASVASAEPVAWLADLNAAIQGKWVAENNARSIEVVGSDVLRAASRFPDPYYGPVGSKLAILGEEDKGRASDNYRFIKAQCINKGTNWTPSPCTAYVNQADTRKGMILQVSDQRYLREPDLTDWGKKHQLRTIP